ncbi:BMP family protein [Microcoleus sp. FACHB-68]|uniref:BMP family protein n=1 Tax=Microcoleus sp. FACHB-68 TaxID=2692826 RepID=UPI001689BE56|nr:BMP family protein [Microcoleus sp. FACHB-68]MBD1940674.1 BMP family protein [Microcoleus sp. FACHB-68]
MDRKYSRRQFIGFSSAALGSSLFLKACTNPASQTTSAGTNNFKVAIVLPGNITDRAWNQSGYEGITLTKQKLGAETSYVEKVGQPDQAEALSDFARRGYNLVFAHGGQFDAAVQQVAGQFPNTFFVAVNGAATGKNIAALRINHMQVSYLCGIIGASMTKSNQLAYLAGQSFEATTQELRGFELGAQSVKPNIKISSSFTGDWNDVAKAKEAALALIASGADVLYQWFDVASPAVLQTAAEKGVYAFGNTTDQLEIAPKAVLTSALKRLDLAIAYLAEQAKTGQLTGQKYLIGLEKPEIVSLGRFGTIVPEAIQTKALTAKAAIAGNKIQFESCQNGGKDTWCLKETAT